MCSARVCRGSHIPEESGGGELSGGEQSLDWPFIACSMAPQSVRLPVVETKIFIHEKLRTFLNQKIHIRAGLCRGRLSATELRVSSFLVELSLSPEPLCSALCWDWDILGRDKPARCKDFTRLITGLDCLTSDKLLILVWTRQSPLHSHHYIITFLLSITQPTSHHPTPALRWKFSQSLHFDQQLPHQGSK